MGDRREPAEPSTAGAVEGSATGVEGSATGADEPSIEYAPADWRVVADGAEAKHAVRGEWSLYLGRGSLQGRRDEWWVTVERAGERVLERERLVVGAGNSPWASVTDLLDEHR